MENETCWFVLIFIDWFILLFIIIIVDFKKKYLFK